MAYLLNVTAATENERTTRQARIPWTSSARIGTCVRGETSDKLRGARPSFASAYGTRAVAMSDACSAPKEEVIIAAAINVTAPAPNNLLTTSAATDDDFDTLATSVAVSTW